MIRALAIDELGAVEDAAREFYAASRFLGKFSTERFCEVWKGLLDLNAGAIFAEDCDGEIVGVIGGIVHREIYGDALIAEEFFWFVRPEFRGAGVALYRRFEQWARAQGATELQMVHLFDSMPEKVAKFYLHSGFEPVEMRYRKALTNGHASHLDKAEAPDKGLRVYDNFLAKPGVYRAQALRLEYKTYEFPEATFHGIAQPTPGDVANRITAMFPAAQPTLSFFRKSPAGQVEPHFIHTDVDMGDWTALLYLNPEPPAGDGTVFWEHVATGERENPTPHLRSEEGRTPAGWRAWRTIEARFNRLVVFPATYYHSRAIFDNWGAGDGARLTQVVFGKGDLPL